MLGKASGPWLSVGTLAVATWTWWLGCVVGPWMHGNGGTHVGGGPGGFCLVPFVVNNDNCTFIIVVVILLAALKY